jgi:hypothetical protein
VQYDYVPVIGYVITGTLNLKDQIYMRPRQSDKINRVTSWQAPAGSAATLST